jgi:APA family basic amino acid/polyamine antiporter
MSEHSFQKVLGRTEVLTLSLGAIIGWGWVVLTGGFIMDAGSLGTVIAFVLSAVIFYFIGLTYAELAAAMPKVGGEHVYSHKALGKHASFICTWSLTLTYVSVVALQAAAMPVALEYFFPDMKYGYLWTFAGYEVYLSYVVFGILTTWPLPG